MNYLAHFYLSEFNKDWLVGNILEDYVVGRVDHPRLMGYPQGIKEGIRLHRCIDMFTDSHPAVWEAKRYFSPKLGKYASAAVDVVFDYFLKKNWLIIANVNFEEFETWVYTTLQSYRTFGPPEFQLFVAALLEYQWLKNYDTVEGLTRSMQNLERKSSGKARFQEAVPLVLAHESAIELLFMPFFSELTQHCRTFTQELTAQRHGRF